jgi:hypothetical protein
MTHAPEHGSVGKVGAKRYFVRVSRPGDVGTITWWCIVGTAHGSSYRRYVSVDRSFFVCPRPLSSPSSTNTDRPLLDLSQRRGSISRGCDKSVDLVGGIGSVRSGPRPFLRRTVARLVSLLQLGAAAAIGFVCG